MLDNFAFVSAMEYAPSSPQEALTINQDGKESLLIIAYWGRFLALSGAFVNGIFVLASIAVMFSDHELTSVEGGNTAFGFISALLNSLLFYPIVNLYRCSRNVRLSFLQKDEQLINRALCELKRVFQFLGIFVAIILGLYILTAIVSLLFS